MLLYLGLSLNAIVVSFHPLVPQIINCRFQVATNRFQIYNSRNLYLNAVFGGLLENFLRKFWRNLGRWGSAIWELKSTTGQRTFIFSGNLFTVCTEKWERSRNLCTWKIWALGCRWDIYRVIFMMNMRCSSLGRTPGADRESAYAAPSKGRKKSLVPPNSSLNAVSLKSRVPSSFVV